MKPNPYHEHIDEMATSALIGMARTGAVDPAAPIRMTWMRDDLVAQVAIEGHGYVSYERPTSARPGRSI